jgi:diacylglycerol kinase family enzyme
VCVTLVHNPQAGHQHRGEADELVELLQQAGHRVRYQSAKEKGLKRVLEKRADLVVVAGGDGTVGKVVRRLAELEREVPLALLPAGTANNIARTLGLVERPFEELIGAWAQARRVKLDIGSAAGPWGERYFIESVGAGIFARLLADPASEKLKDRAAAVESGLRRLQQEAARLEPVEVFAALDGRDISGRYVLFEAVNLRYVGPNLHLVGDADPGDGHFDVVLVGEDERERLLRYLDHWQDNRERLALLPTLRGRRLEIEWTGFALHIDDKLQPKTKIKPKKMAGMVEARIGHAAVELLVPA